MQHDPVSRQHYHHLRARGHSHGRALRGVADRLLAMLCAMLRRHTLFDPNRRHLPLPSCRLTASPMVYRTGQPLWKGTHLPPYIDKWWGVLPHVRLA
ncbi:MAG: hypothetical protein L0099_03600 [Acidobacteria bacterium]|nr:hypothetical protein [Acidobacteriota bacterium]